MKKMVMVAMVVALCLMVAGSAMAMEKKQYGDAGCGLGGMVIGNEPGFIQLVATFLNGICSNQTFGITSGLWAAQRPRDLRRTTASMSLLLPIWTILPGISPRARARPSIAFAELMQVPAEKRAAFDQKLQANFAVIFPSENVVLADVVDNIITVAAN